MRCKYCNEVQFKDSHKEEDCAMREEKEEEVKKMSKLSDYPKEFIEALGLSSNPSRKDLARIELIYYGWTLKKIQGEE